MQHLHSYWRMQYIKQDPLLKKHIFTDIPKAADERSVLLIYRSSCTYIVMNRYPYNTGHLLVVPYRRVENINQLTVKERSDLMETLVKSQQILEKTLSPDGFNMGFNFGSAAGAGIPEHIHGHVVPRWNGDTNFMPIIADTKVLPEALDALWMRLRRNVE